VKEFLAYLSEFAVATATSLLLLLTSPSLSLHYTHTSLHFPEPAFLFTLRTTHVQSVLASSPFAYLDVGTMKKVRGTV
jgi:hypothetical protein